MTNENLLKLVKSSDLGMSKLIIKTLTKQFFKQLQKKVKTGNLQKIELICYANKTGKCLLYTDNLEKASTFVNFDASLNDTLEKFDFVLGLLEEPIQKKDIIEIKICFLNDFISEILMLTINKKLITFKF